MKYNHQNLNFTLAIHQVIYQTFIQADIKHSSPQKYNIFPSPRKASEFRQTIELIHVNIHQLKPHTRDNTQRNVDMKISGEREREQNTTFSRSTGSNRGPGLP